MRPNIGVIFGGQSVEHEISILTATEIMNYIDDDKYNVIPIYIDKDNNWYTGAHLKDIINYRDIAVVKRYARKIALIKDDNRIVIQSLGLLKRNLFVIDFVIPLGHGTYMEDGSLQGYLNMLGIPYAGPDVLASAIGMDKIVLKELLKSHDMPTPKYLALYEKEWEDHKKTIVEQINKEFKYPIYVKPSSLGSSIGITRVTKEEELKKAIQLAFTFGKKILIEEGVNHTKEVNVSVIGDHDKVEVSDVEEINITDEFYTFKEKYVNNYSKRIAKKEKTKMIISKELIDDIKKLAVKTFKLIGCSGVARIDFLLDDKNNKIYINEINTIPGDLSCYIWMNKKKNPEELINDLIRLGLERHKDKKEKTLAFQGNLLERYDILNGSKIKKNK